MEYKGRIVAFANLTIIDDGKTGWMEHMRVHWRYRKRGFAWTMTQRLISEAQALGVDRIRLATTIENEATLRITKQLGIHEILRLKVFWKGNYRGLRWKDTSVPIMSCTPQQAYTFLNANPELIPEGVITYYWHSFDFTKTSIESLGTRFQFWKGEGKESAKTLAFGYIRPFHGALLWCSTIYALDKASFYSALSQQLQAAKKEQAQEVLCFHSPQFQAAHDIPGLKQSTFATMFLVHEKRHPFTIQQ
jgi:hypothetical protein